MTRDQKNGHERQNSEQLILDLAAEVESLAANGAVHPTEQVLGSHSEIVVDDELIMSLLYEEIVTAERNSRSLPEEELIKRFPALSDRIRRLVAFHQTLNPLEDCQESLDTDATWRSNDTDSPVNPDNGIEQSVNGPRQPLEIDQFEILEKIGQGGMGIVYRARQKNLNRIVALKRLRNPFVDSDDRLRLVNEAQAVARLKHPGIVQIHHIGETHGQPYLCFEFIDGSQLADRLRRSTLSPDDACRLLQKIAGAISFAHENGIIHRDLKPANILIDSDGQPKVADFGLAKFQFRGQGSSVSDRLTQTGAVLGTVCYMAPEQFTGVSQDVDHRADIYGLGTILYEMLVGRPPLIGDTPDETMYQVRMKEPVAPRRLNSKIPRDVETICLKCLEKDPARRFQTCAELEHELQRYLSGQPLSIRPTSSITMAARWCKRRPTVALLSALSALLLVTLSIGGYWMAWSQKQHALDLKKQSDLSLKSAQRAAQKAEEADLATQFMINTLGSAHPNRDGRNVTVAERLADGLREIQYSYGTASAGKAALLTAIGKTYTGLGLRQEAETPLKQAWNIYSQLNGDDSLEALMSEAAYGDLLIKLGRYDQAQQHLLHSRDGLISILGPNASESILAVNNVAKNLYQQGHRKQAIEIFAANYNRARQSLEPLEETTLRTLQEYAEALTRVGEFQSSRELIEDTLPRVSDYYGPDHSWVISLKGALASIERAEGNFPLALERFQEIYQLLSKKLGESHIETLISLNGVAISYTDMGDFAQANEILKKIMEQMARSLGESHPQTFRSILNYARTMEHMDRHSDARELLRKSYELALTALGPDHPETMMMATNYGRSLAENNQLEQSETLLTNAVEFFSDSDGVEPLIRGEPFTQLGALYKRTDRAAQAVVLYERALEILRNGYGETNPNTLSAKNNLATAYYKTQQIELAIQMFREVLSDLRSTLGDDNPRTVRTALNLAILYRDEKRSEEAVDLLLKIVPILRRDAKGYWLTGTAQFQLGRAYLDIQQIDSASEHLEVAYAGFEQLLDQQPASQRIGLANQINVIANQFESLGKPDMAETWRQRQQSLLDE